MACRPRFFRDKLILGDEMNPKRAYGSYTLIGIIVVMGINYPNFRVHLVPKDMDTFKETQGSS